MKSTKTICLRLLLLWSFFTVPLLSAFAQTVKVSGRIINGRTSAPAAGATINVKNTTRFATADDAGRLASMHQPGMCW